MAILCNYCRKIYERALIEEERRRRKNAQIKQQKIETNLQMAIEVAKVLALQNYNTIALEIRGKVERISVQEEVAAREAKNRRELEIVLFIVSGGLLACFYLSYLIFG